MTCVNGEWVPGGTASSTGSGASCPGGPIPGMTCINGEWTPTGSAGGGGGSTLPVCTGGNMAAPMPTWVRIGATEWVPPDSPLAVNATCRAQ